MSNNQNLFRDQFHSLPGQPETTFAPTASAILPTIRMNSTGVVFQTAGMAHQAFAGIAATGGNQWVGSGLLMSQPVVDDTPYRLKLYALGDNCGFYAFWGYAPIAPTGSNDVITKVNIIPMAANKTNSEGQIDEVILFPGVPEGNSDFGKPIAFGIGVGVTSGTGSVVYSLLVQNLAKTVF